MELGLCNDMKKLMKKKVRRGMKEGDAGYLEKASGSDSAMEDSSSDEEEEADDNQASDGNDNNSHCKFSDFSFTFIYFIFLVKN